MLARASLGWESLLRKYYHAEGVRRVWWHSRRHAYSPEFQKYLATTKPPEDLSSVGEIFDDAVPKQRKSA